MLLEKAQEIRIFAQQDGSSLPRRSKDFSVGGVTQSKGADR